MEPERKIEKLLRAYARKRRADAGDELKLHPVNRRLLQSEIARRTPSPGEGSLFSLIFAVFRQRLAFALCVVAIAVVGASMLLPTLSSAKKKAQSASAMNKLREIGMAVRQYARDNKDRLPVSLDQVTNALGTRQSLIDPATGRPFVYAGAGEKLDDLQSNVVLAYSLADKNGHAVLFADWRVETVADKPFAELTKQKSLELALADRSARERIVKTLPAAAPVASGTLALTPPSTENTEIALAREESNAGELGVSAAKRAEPANRQLELAESEAKKLEPVAMPAPIHAAAGPLGGVAQTTSVNGSISGKLAATENSDALARNRSFDRIKMQTTGQSGFATSQNLVQASVPMQQNLFKNSVASAQAAPVLQSFQVQQNGDAISVVDRDGSVYNGSVQPANATVRNEPPPAESAAAPAAPSPAEGKAAQAAGNEQQAAQNYFFRVAGTNRTLKQNVVFTGNVEPMPNTAANAPQLPPAGNFSLGGLRGGGGAGGQDNQPIAANQAPQSGLLSNARIVGTAVIDRTNQIEINAVPIVQ